MFSKIFISVILLYIALPPYYNGSYDPSLGASKLVFLFYSWANECLSEHCPHLRSTQTCLLAESHLTSSVLSSIRLWFGSWSIGRGGSRWHRKQDRRRRFCLDRLVGTEWPMLYSVRREIWGNALRFEDGSSSRPLQCSSCEFLFGEPNKWRASPLVSSTIPWTRTPHLYSSTPNLNSEIQYLLQWLPISSLKFRFVHVGATMIPPNSYVPSLIHPSGVIIATLRIKTVEEGGVNGVAPYSFLSRLYSTPSCSPGSLLTRFCSQSSRSFAASFCKYQHP